MDGDGGVRDMGRRSITAVFRKQCPTGQQVTAATGRSERRSAISFEPLSRELAVAGCVFPPRG